MPELRTRRLLRLEPHRHAALHAKEAGHPVMRSFEPGESWRWCYLDDEIV